MKRCKSDWSELPLELLSKIGEFLETQSPSDICRFQQVCKKWHSLVPFSVHLLYVNLPLQLPVLPSIFKQSGKPLFIVGCDVFLLQPLKQPHAKPWLVSFQEVSLGKLQLCLPFNIPSREHLPSNFPKALNLANFRVSLMANGFKLCFNDGNEDVVHDVKDAANYELEVFSLGRNGNGMYCKKLKSCWAGYPAKSKLEMISLIKTSFGDCSVTAFMLLLCKGGRFAVLREPTGKWEFIKSNEISYFDDMVRFRGFICIIDREGRAYHVNVHGQMKVMSEPMCTGGASDRRKVLAVSGLDLYLIERLRYKFRVYKLSRGSRSSGMQHNWVEVNTLGDKILFVTYDKCFFVDAQEISGLPNNCILFPKNCFPDYSGQSDWDDELFEGASKYLEIGLFFLGDDRCRLISSLKGLSDLFWPPPSWIYPQSGHSPLDRRGKTYSWEYNHGGLECVVNEPLGEGFGEDRKKRLVVSCGEVYLVYRNQHTSIIDFTVYTLNSEQGKWEEVEGVGVGDDKILFVTYDGSFVASADEFPGWKGNCIVFYRGCFPTYTGTMDPDYEIAVFHFDNRECKSLDSCPGYPDVFCSLPSWVSADMCSSKCVSMEVEVQPRDSSTPMPLKPNSELKMAAASMLHVENVDIDKKIAEREVRGDSGEEDDDSVQAANSLLKISDDGTSSMNCQGTALLSITHPDSSVAISDKIVENAISLEKFQGVNVSAYLVPVLQQIWDKHGNVIQGHAARTDGLLSWALESLAKMIVILQSSGKSLSDSQAEYLDSSLLDLQLMRFNIDWLAPYVNSALALHKNKDQIRTVTELESAKSRLLAELHGVEERLAEHSKMVAENLSVSSLVDATKVLG